MRPMAEQIAAPTLVLCGDSDMPPFLDAARWLAENVPQARLDWRGPARRASILEQPEAFRRAVREFLG
jgi:pimeloyl-ACP methyl ester carboxylesterase